MQKYFYRMTLMELCGQSQCVRQIAFGPNLVLLFSLSLSFSFLLLLHFCGIQIYE